MRLSAKAFNNIIIFAMLAMIMLFNMDTWLPKPSFKQQTHLISEQDMVLRIDIGRNRIERVGTGWRLTTEPSVTPEVDANQIIQHWLNAELSVVESTPQVLETVIADVWLAAQDNSARLILMRTETGTYVQIAEQSYRIDNSHFLALTF